jgi:hypothetical protein
MIQGNPKFDGIAVAKIEIDFLKNPVHIDVQAAFVNVKTGDTHGWTRGAPGWSDDTRLLIKSLRESMERDLASTHFAGSGVAVTGSATTSSSSGGLSEHLGAVDTSGGVPSV